MKYNKDDKYQKEARPPPPSRKASRPGKQAQNARIRFHERESWPMRPRRTRHVHLSKDLHLIPRAGKLQTWEGGYFREKYYWRDHEAFLVPLPPNMHELSRARTRPQVSSKANFSSLPVELILDIVEYFLPKKGATYHYRVDVQTAACLSLVNRRMHAIIEEHFDLYRCYDTLIGNPYLFLRTMITNPKLASKVEKIRCYNINNGKTYRPSSRDRYIIETGFQALEKTPYWKSQPRSGKKWAQICNDNPNTNLDICAAIVLHTPNIKVFRHGMSAAKVSSLDEEVLKLFIAHAGADNSPLYTRAWIFYKHMFSEYLAARGIDCYFQHVGGSNWFLTGSSST